MLTQTEPLTFTEAPPRPAYPTAAFLTWLAEYLNWLSGYGQGDQRIGPLDIQAALWHTLKETGPVRLAREEWPEGMIKITKHLFNEFQITVRPDHVQDAMRWTQEEIGGDIELSIWMRGIKATLL